MTCDAREEAEPEGKLRDADPRPGLGAQLPAERGEFSRDQYEGIKIHDWEKWEDPFRLTMDAYWKYQGEKERKLYAIIDAFQQNNGQFNVSDARYSGAQVVHHRLHADSNTRRIAASAFSVANSRCGSAHRRTDAVDGRTASRADADPCDESLQQVLRWHERVPAHARPCVVSVDAEIVFRRCDTSGPFEFITAISFAFEYVLTNLLFMPCMSGAAYNGDMSTVTFGFSAQSDEARHMTLGIEVIKFLLEQDPENVPIVQRWIDKWFWRGYRLLSLLAVMMDYMLPKRVMSWSEAWEIYFEQNGGALFADLSRYGIRMPKHWEVTVKEKGHVSHQLWSTFYQFRHAAGFPVWLPTAEEMDWLSAKYPDTFDQYYRPRYEYWADLERQGKPFVNATLPQLCQTCQWPLLFTEADDPTQICYREETYLGNKFHFCSDGCKDIFREEPEKYVHAHLPVHQIYQGNYFNPGVDPTAPDFNPLVEALKYMGITPGVDGGDFATHIDAVNWTRWTNRSANMHEPLTTNAAPDSKTA